MMSADLAPYLNVLVFTEGPKFSLWTHKALTGSLVSAPNSKLFPNLKHAGC